MAKATGKASGKASSKASGKATTKAAGKSASSKSTSASKGSTKAAAKKGSTRKPNAAFMAPLTVSPEMQSVIGDKPMPRTEIIKRIWDYIKKNDLQDSKNRRMINADDKLKPVFDGKKQISMFELAKVVNNHVKK